MSAEELKVLTGLLREGELDLTDDPVKARADFEAMLAGVPLPPGAAFEPVALGGIPGLASVTPGADKGRTLLYLHGGAFVIGSAQAYRPLWSGLAAAAGIRAVAIDYRLAPEHPFPAAIEDALSAYQALLDGGASPGSIVVAGDSAGGGLTVALLAAARAKGLPMPAAAVALSPWADLECLGGSITSKAAEDPALDREGLLYTAGLYLNGASARDGRAAALHADLEGLPPLLIQVGSAEVLLDDAVRLAGRAGAAGVDTRLEIWPHMPHVWHMFGFMLSEGREASAAAARFMTEKLAGG